MKKYWWIVVLLLLVIVVIWWWSSPDSSLRETTEELAPQVRVASLSITDITDEKVNVVTTVILKNPYPVDLNTDKLHYTLVIDSSTVVKSTYNKAIRIRSSDTTSLQLPMEILLDPMERVLERLEERDQDSAVYSFNANMRVDVPVAGDRNISFAAEKKLPVIRTLKIDIIDVDVKKLGLNESNLNIVLEVKNPNSFDIEFGDASYEVTIDRDQQKAMKGRLTEVVSLPAKGSEEIAMKLTMNLTEIGELAWKSIFEKRDTKFNLAFRSRLLTENNLLENSTLAFTIDGTLSDVLP